MFLYAACFLVANAVSYNVLTIGSPYKINVPVSQASNIVLYAPLSPDLARILIQGCAPLCISSSWQPSNGFCIDIWGGTALSLDGRLPPRELPATPLQEPQQAGTAYINVLHDEHNTRSTAQYLGIGINLQNTATVENVTCAITLTASQSNAHIVLPTGLGSTVAVTRITTSGITITWQPSSVLENEYHSLVSYHVASVIGPSRPLCWLPECNVSWVPAALSSTGFFFNMKPGSDIWITVVATVNSASPAVYKEAHAQASSVYFFLPNLHLSSGYGITQF